MFRFGAVVLLVVGASLSAVADSAAILCQGSKVTIWGTPGNDRIVGTDGRDVIHGLDGDDVIKGFGGNDIICGGSGDDTLLGGLGADLLQGGDGADLIKGGAGKDQLYGGPGDDVMQGGPADDLLYGGAGLDSCYGGSQVDRADSCESPVATEVGDRPPVRSQPGPQSVALTFDDGPHPYYTPAVLDVLARYGVKATFFVVGAKAAAYPGLIQRMIAEGHSVQNHCYSHAWLTRCSDAVASHEIGRGRDAIESATGIESRCLRPPFGATNSRIVSLAAAEGHTIVMWSVDPQDWRNHDSRWVADQVLRTTGGGDIVLLHDGAGYTAARALPSIIEVLKTRGLSFVSICD
ncbi:MAG: polysaccharide deacetylase family protein [Acidimicrobiia bacterium]